MPETLLVPVDFSEIARAALVVAAERASASDARLILLHVLHVPARNPGFYGRAGLRRPGLVPREQQATLLMAELLARVRRERPDLPALRQLRTLLVEGLPAARIAEVAEREAADLIVLGCRRRSRIHRLLWGSVAVAVERRTAVRVLRVEGDASPTPSLSCRRATA